MDKEMIENKMHNVERIIGYEFLNVGYLSEAMNRCKIYEFKKGMVNEYYALIGDGLLKIALIEHLHSLRRKTPDDITKIKSLLESNNVLYYLSLSNGLTKYAYNDTCFAYEEKKKGSDVSVNGHDPFIEAISAAIYYDRGYESSLKWIKEWAIPKMYSAFED